MDRLRFLDICERITTAERQRASIGTLGEKTLHAVLKEYFEPFEGNREIKVAGFVADIVGEDGIIEIQTRSFDKMRKKLEKLLKVSRVKVVFPVARNKYLSWVDTETGEITKRRKSPRIGKPQEIFAEIYKIKHLLKNQSLSFCIAMVDVTEYRYLNGWSEDKKKGSSRSDRVPLDICEEIHINNINDYLKLIPDSLIDSFSSKDFKKASGLSLGASQTALNVLSFVGAVEKVGKRGNLILYSRAEEYFA